jgi:hypothetical protein
MNNTPTLFEYQLLRLEYLKKRAHYNLLNYKSKGNKKGAEKWQKKNDFYDEQIEQLKK